MRLAETLAPADERRPSTGHPVHRAAIDVACRTQNGQVSGPAQERATAARLPHS